MFIKIAWDGRKILIKLNFEISFKECRKLYFSTPPFIAGMLEPVPYATFEELFRVSLDECLEEINGVFK